MNISFLLLNISALLTFILLILILRIKNKKALHYFFLLADLDIFLWCAVWLLEQYTEILDGSMMLFINIQNTLIFPLSVLLFFIGYLYAKSGAAINKKLYLLFFIPLVFSLLSWTNDFHHLFYLGYSSETGGFLKGPLAAVITYVDYGLIAVGLFYLMKFTIKNAGFFSKQSALIILGTTVPVITNVIIFMKIFEIPKYFDAVTFSFTVICFLIAVFRYDLFTIVPVALQTIVDHISDSYLVINEHMEITDFNRTFSESFKEIAYVRRKIRFDLIFIEALSLETEEIVNRLVKAVKEQQPEKFEIHINEKNYDKYFIAEITPVISNGALVCTIVLFKDITEQKKDAELIAKTQLMLIESEHLASLGQLVGGIAHNLKSPIMSVAGGLEGLSDLIDEYDESVGDKAVTTEDHREIASEMRTWISKMREYTAYMSDVISAVKGQAVQLTASTTDSFTLHELIKRVDILMNHELKRYSCRLDVHCELDMAFQLKGEVNSFVQVINNLIINAIDAYEGREGVIEVNISKNGQMVLFEVKDSGVGMTDEVKSRLFKEMITTKAKNGTGLGLYMSYSTITGRFGGKMWFESVHGMGTSFYIMIPAA